MLTASNPQLAVFLALTRAISRSGSLHEIYTTALDALESALGVSRSSILLFDDDGIMRFKASRLLSEEYRAAVEGHSPWDPGSLDPDPIVVADVRQDPSLAHYLPAIEAEGIAAMAFIPLVSGGRVIGKFMLYYEAPRALSADELQLARLIASQVAFAVERTRAEEQARLREERLRFALDAANMGTWEWDLRTQTLHWSDNLERVHGLPRGAFDGTFACYEREIHPDDRERVIASIDRAISHGVPHEVEYRIVSADGTVRWVEGKGRVERGPDGRPERMTGVCLDVTPRKAAEQARIEAVEASHRASERLAAIVDSSGDAIISKTLDGLITSWNRTAERMFGYPAADAVGQPVTLIIPPDRRGEELDVLARIRAGEQVEIETVRQRRDGTLIPVSLMVSPVRDTGGRIVGASKVARDISARKRDEAERAELHRRLTMLVQASASLLHSPDTQSVVAATIALAQRLLVSDGYAVWLNEPEAGIWRMVKSAGVSSRFAGRILASGRDASSPPAILRSGPLPISDVTRHPMLAGLGAAYKEEGIESMLVCPMRLGGDAAGTLVFYYRQARRFTDLDLETGQALANLSAAAITTADLYDKLKTERNAAEAARRRAAFLADATAILSRSLDYEQTFAAVARLAVPEIADWCVVYLVDHAGHVQPVAVAHADPAKVEQARRLHERYAPDPDTLGGVHEVVRAGKPAMTASISPEMIAAYARDEDHRRLLEELTLTSYMCVPLVSAGGTLGALSFVFAESGRHYTAQDLAFAEELAARAALALENAIAYRRVNEASRLKDEFLATLSHELRTPLNAILGYSQMLNMRALAGERQSHALAVLMRNAESLKQIIEDVLDVSRITSGKLRLSVQPVDLRDILRNAAATVQPAADAKGVRIAMAIDAPVPPVLGDPDRLQQIAWNLLSNAVKFTPRGGHVDLRLEEVSASVQILVSDNGQGIHPAFLPHIFERFRQADSRFSREHGGLGLGLAIVRELTELHGGTVAAASDGPGKGARFTVRLPVMTTLDRPRADEVETRRFTPGSVPQQIPQRLTGVRILAVDNDDDALGLLRVTLESAGARVTTASSGAAAIELLRRLVFDALVADIGMPQMDGLELIRQVRTSLPPPANQIPAAALTAYTRGEDRVAALAHGFQMHVSKPFHPTELVLSIATMIGR